MIWRGWKGGSTACALVILALMPVVEPQQGQQQQQMDERMMSMWRESQKAEAEGRLADALSIAGRMPQDAGAVFRQGKLLTMMGEYREAALAFEAVERAAPDFPSLLAYIAFVKWKLGDEEASAKVCATALEKEALDIRAVAILRNLPRRHQAGHSRLMERYNQVSGEAHRRLGMTDPPPRFPSHNKRASPDLTLVTSVNSLYFGCLANHIGSLQLREPGLSILVYDLGLDPLERLVVQEWKSVTVVPFPFEEYPPHVRNLRNYAWKPLVYQHAISRHRKIFYQDSGQEAWQSLGLIDSIIDRDGYFYVMQGERTLPEKIHPAMFAAMQVNPRDFEGKDMCAGGIQGYRNDSVAITEVLEATISCALNQDCISPEGSNQGNHRFDQSAFSIQMSRGMYRCHSSWLFRAYLEPHRIKEADTYDVPDGFGSVDPIIFSRRCGPPFTYFPLLKDH